ncbi:MAG: hypothetical protein ACLFVX_08500 [Archaeoglobaceae archaeon]
MSKVEGFSKVEAGRKSRIFRTPENTGAGFSSIWRKRRWSP